MSAERLCTKCNLVKSQDAFAPSLWANGTKVCRSCWSLMRIRWEKNFRAENPEKYKQKTRAWNLKRQYGISIADYERMVTAQGHVCAICKSESTKAVLRGKAARWHIDHDHVTGNIRGLLCAKCNLGLGSFEDNPDALRAAADYLERAKKPAIQAA